MAKRLILCWLLGLGVGIAFAKLVLEPIMKKKNAKFTDIDEEELKQIFEEVNEDF